jgi:thiol:disulfide interchange protein DsbC
MFKICLAIVTALCLLFAVWGFAAPKDAHNKNTHNCAKCHALENEEAATILKDAIPNLKVLGVSQAPVKGLWEVFLQSGNRKGLVYIDYSKKIFISGAMIDIKEKNNLTEARFQELNKVDTSKIPLEDALVLGDKKAQYRVIVFSDPDCPYCGKLHEEMKKVLEKRNDIVFFIKLFPLSSIHPNAYWKSKSILCKQSLQMLEDNFAQKPIEKVECPTKVLEANIKLASELGINGTPAMVLSNGRVLPGYREADALIELITSK